MKSVYTVAIVVFLFCSCNNAGHMNKHGDSTAANSSLTDSLSATNSTSFDINSVRLDSIPESFRNMIMVSSGQMSHSTIIQIDGCEFNLVNNDEDTTYLSTNDIKFQTPEGYKVGTVFSALPKEIQKRFSKEPGWGYYYTLPSGWALGFCEGGSCTENYPGEKSTVKWIFKRH